MAVLWECHCDSCPTGADLCSQAEVLAELFGKASLSQVVGRSAVSLHAHLQKWPRNWYSATILGLHQTQLCPSKLLMISASSQKQHSSLPPQAFPVSTRGLTLTLGVPSHWLLCWEYEYTNPSSETLSEIKSITLAPKDSPFGVLSFLHSHRHNVNFFLHSCSQYAFNFVSTSLCNITPDSFSTLSCSFYKCQFNGCLILKQGEP